MQEKKTATGYSGTPLVKKLGIAPGMRVYVKNEPLPYHQLVPSIPDSVTLLKRRSVELDMAHLFVTKRNELKQVIDAVYPCLKANGSIWVSWPKKSSGVKSEVTEDTIREVILPMGLVDVKVCAVDEIWSGLKVVIRKENRSRA